MQIKKCEVLFEQEIKINLFKSYVITFFFNVHTQHNKENERKNIFILNSCLPCFFNR